MKPIREQKMILDAAYDTLLKCQNQMLSTMDAIFCYIVEDSNGYYTKKAADTLHVGNYFTEGTYGHIKAIAELGSVEVGYVDLDKLDTFYKRFNQYKNMIDSMYKQMEIIKNLE